MDMATACQYLPACAFLRSVFIYRWEASGPMAICAIDSLGKKEIDFRALYDAVIPISTLPEDTVQSMLETLPSSGDLVAEQGVSASTRMAIAAVVTTIHKCRSDDIALKVAGYSIAGSAHNSCGSILDLANVVRAASRRADTPVAKMGKI